MTRWTAGGRRMSHRCRNSVDWSSLRWRALRSASRRPKSLNPNTSFKFAELRQVTLAQSQHGLRSISQIRSLHSAALSSLQAFASGVSTRRCASQRMTARCSCSPAPTPSRQQTQTTSQSKGLQLNATKAKQKHPEEVDFQILSSEFCVWAHSTYRLSSQQAGQ
eukprot:1070889-Rhodomonas_salina.2